jgi:uncharacterized membrane protein
MLLILGLLLWSGIHLFPSLMPDARKKLSAKLGEMQYQGLFAVCILLSLALIIIGWRSAVPAHVYAPIPALRHVAMLLVVVGFILMVAANFPATRIKRFLRHPQLTGVLLWSLAHLLANGDSRSLALFSVTAVWSLLSMKTINQRDGAWQKPESVMPLYAEALIVVIGAGVAAVAVWFHIYLSGIPLIAT